PPPPGAPLFPYTTLFRSVRGGPAGGPSRWAGATRGAARRAAADVGLPCELRLQGQALRASGAPAAARASPRLEGDLLARPTRRADRKSTRLNSSHLGISY